MYILQIEADFIKIFGETKSDSLCSEFALLSSQIILQAKNCGIKSAEDLASNLLFDIADSETISESKYIVFTFYYQKFVLKYKNL